MDDIVSFRTPGHVVGIAERIDLQSADVGGKERKILR